MYHNAKVYYYYKHYLSCVPFKPKANFSNSSPWFKPYDIYRTVYCTVNCEDIQKQYAVQFSTTLVPQRHPPQVSPTAVASRGLRLAILWAKLLLSRRDGHVAVEPTLCS